VGHRRRVSRCNVRYPALSHVACGGNNYVERSVATCTNVRVSLEQSGLYVTDHWTARARAAITVANLTTRTVTRGHPLSRRRTRHKRQTGCCGLYGVHTANNDVADEQFAIRKMRCGGAQHGSHCVGKRTGDGTKKKINYINVNDRVHVFALRRTSGREKHVDESTAWTAQRRTDWPLATAQKQ